MSPSSISGNRYPVSFIDEFIGYAAVEFMKYKTKALQTFKNYVAQNGRPKNFRTDNETEYKKSLKKICISKEIAREITVPETPEKNDVAERFNRTVVKAARCLLLDSKWTKIYRVRAVDKACYARNLVVKDKNTKSVFKKFFVGKPRTHHLKIFGSVAHSKHRDASEKPKFDPKATKCLLIGYSDNTTNYLLQNIKTRQIFPSRNVRFNKNNLTGFHNEYEDIDDSFLYLNLDEIREKLQDISNSTDSSSEVETTETESFQKLLKLLFGTKRQMP